MDDEIWYYLKNNRQCGPVPKKVLIEMIDSGTIPKDSLVWSENRRIRESAKVIFKLAEDNQSDLRGDGVLVGTNQWSASPAHPWRRYFARVFDSVILSPIVFAVPLMATYYLSPEMADIFSSLISICAFYVFLVTFLSALLLSFFGTTVGKWIFGIRITEPDGKAVSLKKAWMRELKVFIWGLGLYIPLISLFTLISSYNHLTKYGETTWDGDLQVKVSYRDNGLFQTAMNVAGVLLIIVMPYLFSWYVSLMHI